MKQELMNSWTGFWHNELTELAICWFKGGLIMVAGWLLARQVCRLLRTAFDKAKVKKDIAGFVEHLAFYTMLTLTMLAALSEIGVDTNSFLAVLGGAALAVGLGLKDQLGQLTAGIMLLIKHPFRTGDFVTLAGETGTVETIDFFQTTLKTLDSKKVILPNSLAMGSVITNFSAYPQRRIDLPVLVSYSDNLSVAKQSMLDAALSEELVLKDPEPQVVMTNMQQYGVELTLRCFVVPSNFGKVRVNLLEKVKEGVQSQGCTIPLPQLVLHERRNA